VPNSGKRNPILRHPFSHKKTTFIDMLKTLTEIVKLKSSILYKEKILYIELLLIYLLKYYIVLLRGNEMNVN
jgi:hypothetical protein